MGAGDCAPSGLGPGVGPLLKRYTPFSAPLRSHPRGRAGSWHSPSRTLPAPQARGSLPTGERKGRTVTCPSHLGHWELSFRGPKRTCPVSTPGRPGWPHRLPWPWDFRGLGTSGGIADFCQLKSQRQTPGTGCGCRQLPAPGQPSRTPPDPTGPLMRHRSPPETSFTPSPRCPGDGPSHIRSAAHLTLLSAGCPVSPSQA